MENGSNFGLAKLDMSIAIRPAEARDVAAVAAIRARMWETEAYWLRRIAGYLSGELSPGQALPARAVFVAENNDNNHTIVGFVAGHRTRRHRCKGELEWIDVVSEHRGQGIAGKLLTTIAAWFVSQNALRVCVDVEPTNAIARSLYAKHGAVPLNPHWMVWENVRGMTGTPDRKLT